ncbi:hypothetical protein VTL71DRAFT_15833 [Oculimacula yallundae]|uniref:Heterokaryon incompatibility domain-containing protein n=1 Tax=Oculimacula yallundae TaxID=86028 RepID=A0ABR4CDI9_9HELO
MDVGQVLQGGSPPYLDCPLDRLSNEARLATIAPGSWDDPISCTLRVVSLDVPLPEVLSYAWGDPNVTDTMLLNGHQTAITVNLHTALQWLRYLDKTREIWIDAICINQLNLAERTHQVSMMSRIYSQALKVFVWLGPGGNFAKVGFETLAAMAEDKTLHYNTDMEPHIRPPIFESGRWEACLKIFTAPWWGRTWTVQEAVLPSNLTFICGQYSLPGETFFRGIEQHYVHGSSQCCSEYLQKRTTYEGRSVMVPLLDLGNASHVNKKQKEQDSTILDFSRILFNFGSRKSYDTRDKVYGLLALARGVYQDLVVADYQAKVEDVYTKASFELLSRSGDLSSLQLRDTNWTLSALALPSWVTDWSTRPSNTTRWLINSRFWASESYDASGSTKAVVRFVEPDRLLLTGYLLGRIASVVPGPTLTYTTNHEDTAEICSSLERYLQEKWTSIAPQYPKILDATTMLPHLLVGGVLWQSGDGDRIQAESPLVCADAYRNWYTWVKGGRTFSRLFSDEINVYSDSLELTVMERKLFVTEEGYVGFGEDGIEPGDMIAVLCGGKCPYILRRVESEEVELEDSYKLIGGPAYIHGLMNGEATKQGRDLSTIILQ